MKPVAPAASPAHELAPLRAWLDRFAACVRDRDFDTARAMFDADVASFGTWTRQMIGRDTLETDQWQNVWPRTCGFAFEGEPLAGAFDGRIGWVAVLWHSFSANADGTSGVRRSGRATIAFRRDDRVGLLATHTHFSFDPAGTLMPASPSLANVRG